jgi:hypothetical protein
LESHPTDPKDPPRTQRKIYEFVTLQKGRSHDLGLTKVESNFEHSPEHSILWGDKLSASKQKVDGDVFRTYSHNLNAFSCSDDDLDVKQFAEAIHAKDAALVSLYEVNRNFQEQSVLNSFHHHLRGVSTHHHGAVSSAQLTWTNSSRFGTSGPPVISPRIDYIETCWIMWTLSPRSTV